MTNIKNFLGRMYFGHVFYRIPKTFRLIGYVNLRDGVLIGPFGFKYRTYDFHLWGTPVLGKERFIGVRIMDK